MTEWGNRTAFDLEVTESNTLTLGMDLRLVEVDNSRERVAAPGYMGGLIGLGVVQAPLAVDSRTRATAFYLSDSQRFLDDRVRVRAGVRYQRTREQALATQNSPVVPSSETRDVFVYQLGATWQARDWLVLRGNVGTGFLAANATQLFGVVQQANGNAILPNADLKDVKSLGWDVGARVDSGGFVADVAFYENSFRDYMLPVVVPGTAALQWQNADRRTVRGIQGEISQELAEVLHTGDLSVVPYLGGNWIVSTETRGFAGQPADQAFLADYTLNAGVRVGQREKWGMDLFVTAVGSSQINAGILQNFNVPLAQVEDLQRVPSFVVLNLAAHRQVNENFTIFGGVNNILDRNYHPYFLARNDGGPSDVAPWLLPGVANGVGVSAPGREFFCGVTVRF